MTKRRLDIASLTPEERFGLLEELWDSLVATPETIPLSAAQLAELDRRLDDLEREGPVGTRSPALATPYLMATFRYSRPTQ